MKARFNFIKIGFITLVLFSCSNREDVSDLSFIITTDWRQYSTEYYQNSEYFQGALEDIKRTGKGDFMISPGDVEPQHEAFKLIKEILGEDYPWYPAIGNHEIEHEEYVEWFREYNNGGNTLPNIVNIGPEGCEETTFSFDWKNCHFIVLNEYYDGLSDMGTDGQIVPELLNWLENDLKSNNKQFCFVIGHEPINPQPDMESGRVRHRGDSLDQYPISTMKFFQLLKKYNIKAYIHGHNHSTSIVKLNGVWMLDAGHAKGTEEVFPEALINLINQKIEAGKVDEDAIKEVFLENDPYYVKKTLYYMGVTKDQSYKAYKRINDKEGLASLTEFYNKVSVSQNYFDERLEFYLKGMLPTKSTYYRVDVSNKEVVVNVYRRPLDKIEYEKVESIILN